MYLLFLHRQHMNRLDDKLHLIALLYKENLFMIPNRICLQDISATIIRINPLYFKNDLPADVIEKCKCV